MTGTPFRTLLAPINAATGDGRRFAAGAISLAGLPMPFEWARSREGGHDGAVAVGAIQEAKVLTIQAAVDGDWISADGAKGLDPKSEAVFGKGVMFDDADRETMPRLAEDVAEAMHLATNGTLGPSVDLDSFDAVPVMKGSDEPITYEELEAYWEEHGEEPELELLITAGRVRAATLVTIPAFSETSRPFELLGADDADPEQAAADTDELRALVASVTDRSPEGGPLPPVGRFALPALAGPTPMTWDWENGRVFGHIATWRTCHVGYSDVCVTAPRAGEQGYSWFNRYAVDTSDGGTIWAGRLTLGGQHAGLTLSASSAMAVHDSKTVAADVVAYEDEHGIVLAGSIRNGLTGADRMVLDRQKVSGDWREVSGSLALVEVLALSPGARQHAEPGFPVATHSFRGRQVALTASFGPEDVPGRGRPVTAASVDVEALVRNALAEADRQRAEAELAAVARTELAVVVQADTERQRAELAALVGEG